MAKSNPEVKEKVIVYLTQEGDAARVDKIKDDWNDFVKNGSKKTAKPVAPDKQKPDNPPPAERTPVAEKPLPIVNLNHVGPYTMQQTVSYVPFLRDGFLTSATRKQEGKDQEKSLAAQDAVALTQGAMPHTPALDMEALKQPQQPAADNNLNQARINEAMEKRAELQKHLDEARKSKQVSMGDFMTSKGPNEDETRKLMASLPAKASDNEIEL